MRRASSGASRAGAAPIIRANRSTTQRNLARPGYLVFVGLSLRQVGEPAELSGFQYGVPIFRLPADAVRPPSRRWAGGLAVNSQFMVQLKALSSYSDDNGNVIEFSGNIQSGVTVTFTGKNNRIVAPEGVRIARLAVQFDCDNGVLVLGANTKVGGIQASIRIGQDSTVKFGDNINMTGICVITALEGTTVSFGDDVMIATDNQFRGDDAHAIFDISTGKRVNVSRDVIIGNHVWFANSAVALAGAHVGDGSVVGFRSLVTGKIPNNCIAVGSPAKVIRRNIAWERPHLSLVPPFYKPDASTVAKSPYWNLTEEDALTVNKRTLMNRLKDAALAFIR